MRLLVCGSRNWTDYATVEETILQVEPSVVIEGGARGADQLAKKAARTWGFLVEEYLADWDRYGKSAGAVRNREMLEQGKPDLVLAFWDGQSHGTKHMIGIARGARVPVKVYLPVPASGGPQ